MSKCFIQSLKAEVYFHAVRQPPADHITTEPIHHGHQIQEAATQRDVGDVTAPNLVRSFHDEVAKQIRIHLMVGMTPAC